MRPQSRQARSPSETNAPGATERRRRLLEHLERRSNRLSERELAARVAADDPESDAEVTEETVRDVHVALRHVDLPKAEAAGFVSWDESSGTVEPVDDPSLCETEARQLFADGWDDDEAVSQYERRRAALAVLREMDGEATVGDLAAEVAAHEAGDDVVPAASGVDDVGVSLHHRHLPGLEDAGLVDYDPTAGTVVYRGPAESDRRDGSSSS